MDVLRLGGIVYSPELGADPRWPYFSPVCNGVGIHSAMALRLSSSEALNLYSRIPDAFGAEDRARAMLLGELASKALTAVRERDDQAARVGNLQAALDTREMIGQAKGILMERSRLSAEEAFNVLRSASQSLNVKLRDVAQRLVDTGEFPTV